MNVVNAVWVNSLWFLSLVISLTCALLATFLQPWARRYMKVTQSRYGLHKRARIRTFFAEGVDSLRLPWAVEALAALLHLSLSLLLSGPRRIPFQYQSDGFHGGHIMRRGFRSHIYMRYIHPNISTRQPILHTAFFVSMVTS
jgi:hypothetical protein